MIFLKDVSGMLHQFLLRGSLLGGTAGAGTATFATTTGPTFIGGTGATGTTTKGILPWAITDTTTVGTFSNGKLRSVGGAIEVGSASGTLNTLNLSNIFPTTSQIALGGNTYPRNQGHTTTFTSGTGVFGLATDCANVTITITSKAAIGDPTKFFKATFARPLARSVATITP
jgi:hypothetical protein